MEATGIFVILLSQYGFESDSPETKFQTISSLSQFEKVSVQKPTAEHWTVISNQVIKYQLANTRFDQIIHYEHDIYLNGKLSAKLLAQAVIKNTKFMFAKT